MDSFHHEIVSVRSRYRFAFHKIKTPSGIKFFVTCTTDGGRETLFTMEKKGADWQIVNAPKVQDEILHFGPRLSYCIKRHL